MICSFLYTNFENKACFGFVERGLSVSPLEYRLQPAFMALAVAIEEGQHFSCGNGSSQKPSSHQTLSLPCSDQTHLSDISDVVL